MMMRATIDRLLKEHSATSTQRILAAQGIHVGQAALNVRISQLIASGERKPLAKPTTFVIYDTSASDAEAGSAALLRAMLKSYAHKAMAKGISMEDAMLTSLYSPEQIQAWKAAA